MGTQAGRRRPSKKLMVLSGAAIFVVYGAGYARTQAAAAQWQTSANLSPTAATSPANGTGTPGAAAANAGAASQPATPSASAAGGGAGTPSTAATNCSTASTPAAVAPPPATYRYGDDGRRERGRDRRGENEGTAALLPATQAQVPCPPTTAQGSGQAAAPAAGSAATGRAQAPSSPAATQRPSTSQSQAQGQSGRSAAPSQSQATAPPAASTSPYKDGVYAGTGWSRHGSVAVALTIKAGKISSVVVTGCTTHYPCADVAPMPGEVLAAQSVQVDIVSGATDSSIAFLGAVQQALGAAQAAKG